MGVLVQAFFGWMGGGVRLRFGVVDGCFWDKGFIFLYGVLGS